MKYILIFAAALSLFAQESAVFNAHVQRWTNHDFPEPLKSMLPGIPPVDAKRDGVLIVVTTTGEAEAIEITVNFKRDGKRHKEVKTMMLGTTGCTPEPCRWAPMIFEIGVVDLASVQVTVQEWSTKYE